MSEATLHARLVPQRISGYPIAGGGSGGTTDHTHLTNRDAADQHPISAITGLRTELDQQSDKIAALEAKYKTITVTVLTQDGVTVTGQTVYLRNGDSASAPVEQTAAYNGQPVTFEVPINYAYFVSVSDTLADHFNPTTASGVTNTDKSVTLTYSDVDNIRTFADLQAALPLSEDSESLQNALIGLEIADTWVAENGTTYDDPMIVVSLENIEDANGETHWGAYVERKWATLNVIQFDAAETDFLNGYNNYRQSAYRQYLNSSAVVGEWWAATHVGDVAPSQLSSVRGYMAGCSDDLLAAAKPCKVSCNTNTVTDGGVVETMVDTFWLPSVTQMYGVGNSDDGVYWPYWKRATGLSSPDNAANEGREIYAIESNTSAQYCCLRSALRNNSGSAWTVTARGTLNTNPASNGGRAAPACAIW